MPFHPRLCDVWKNRLTIDDLPLIDSLVNNKVPYWSVLPRAGRRYLGPGENDVTEAVSFGRRVRALRKAKRLRIADLAEKANTGIKHLGRIERGEKQPSFDLIISLARALNTSPSALFDFDIGYNDLKKLRSRLTQLIEKGDVVQLRQIARLLQVLFEG
jgi:transcriptional regulator with XRE-family HTH domain